jgi:hypothetical protein
MNRTEYVRNLDADVRYRVAFVVDSGRVDEGVVQLEVAIAEEWKPVIRYDTAHGFAHCDRYDPAGAVKRQETLPTGNFNQALTWATGTVRSDWEALVRPFREKTP